MKKAPKLGLAAVAASALLLAACSSGTTSEESAPAEASAAASAAAPAAAGDNADIKVCMYTHGDGGGFWSVAKAGAVKGAEDLGVTLDYQESNNDPEAQAQLIEAGVSAGCTGIAVSAPNPDALKDALAKATEAGIPIVTLNSGSKVFKELGAFTHVGQDEFTAGQGAGEKFNELGVKKIVCVIHEASNIGLQERCDGAKDTFAGTVENLQVSSGLADIAKTQAEVLAYLEVNPDVDGIFSLNADIATGAAMPARDAVGREITIGTVDLSGDAVQAIIDGTLAFGIDQQQYAQGYLPVVLLYLNKINGHDLGGGLPMNTGPGFVTQDNAAAVQQFAANGTR